MGGGSVGVPWASASSGHAEEPGLRETSRAEPVRGHAWASHALFVCRSGARTEGEGRRAGWAAWEPSCAPPHPSSPVAPSLSPLGVP